jgi:ribosome maturation protein Sdo1
VVYIRLIESCLTLSHSETDLDEVLQINNVFSNVSKGQASNSEELQKAFGKTDVSEIVKEVHLAIHHLPD